MEELLKLGYILSFSEACPIVAWGKWYVSLVKPMGHRVTGYGSCEIEAFDDALKTALKIEQK
jgi:hypothetical protein